VDGRTVAKKGLFLKPVKIAQGTTWKVEDIADLIEQVGCQEE